LVSALSCFKTEWSRIPIGIWQAHHGYDIGWLCHSGMVSVLHKLPDGSLIGRWTSWHQNSYHASTTIWGWFCQLIDRILFNNAQGCQYGIRDGVDGLPW
jgi:hypothetical protein